MYNLITVTRDSYKIIDLINDLENIDDTNLNKYYIIDNHSSEEFINILMEVITACSFREKVELIREDKNWLFTHSCNTGIKKSNDSEYIFLVNPDITLIGTEKNELIHPFEDMISYMEIHRAGIAGAKLLFPTGLVEHAGGTENRHIGYGENADLHHDPSEVDWVTGALFCIKRSTVNMIGLLDEKTFPHWVSDQEYCRRAVLAKIRTIYAPVEFTHHQGHGTASEGHSECHKNLPEGIVPNDIPVSVEYIKSVAESNFKKKPLVF